MHTKDIERIGIELQAKRDYWQQRGEMADEALRAEFELLTEVENAKTALIKKEEEARAAAKKVQMERDKQQTAAWFGSTLAMAAQHNKSFFKMYQAYRIGEAIIETHAAAQAAYKWGTTWGGPPGGTAMAVLAVAAGMARVAMIASQKPNYAEGGIATGPQSGYPVTLHGTEAVVPLSGGRSIPVEMKGGGQQKVVQIVLNNPTFQDLETQRETMAIIAEQVARQVAPDAIVKDYYNDGTMRHMIQSRE